MRASQAREKKTNIFIQTHKMMNVQCVDEFVVHGVNVISKATHTHTHTHTFILNFKNVLIVKISVKEEKKNIKSDFRLFVLLHFECQLLYNAVHHASFTKTFTRSV